MRLNSGEGDGASLAGRTSRNTARTVRKVLISRYFLRALISQGIDRQWIVTERHGTYRPRIARLGMWSFAVLSSSTRPPRSVRPIH
jgi:hypothetical protein